MPDIILDLNLLLLAARAMKLAQKSPHVTPFTLDKRDTKDPAPTLVHDKPNKRRRASLIVVDPPPSPAIDPNMDTPRHLAT